jgi:hydrogenase nickel incorporation protein HypA/HybF
MRPVHELSIAQSIVEIVEQTASANGSGRVRSIKLRIGELSGVVVDSLDFCFLAITAGTKLEGAHLEIEHVPLTAECRSCRQTFAVQNNVFLCPFCKSGVCSVVSGRELQVSEIELEDEPQEQT